MIEQNQNIINQEYQDQMTYKYERKIQDGNLVIGNQFYRDLEVINMRFLEKFNIQTLMLYITNSMSLKFKSETIKELTLKLPFQKAYKFQNLIVDDLELENLEVLLFQDGNQLINDCLYNLAKFKKLHTLDISCNNVDLTHIHNVLSLTKLSMRLCRLKNIDQITSLINLENLDLSANEDIDINALCKVKSLIKLNISECNLQQIDQIGSLTNLEVLDVSLNELLKIDSISQLVNLKELIITQNTNIDIAPLQYLVGLIKLDLNSCGLRQLSALKSLTNLQILFLSFNDSIDITELQYLKNLTHLYLNKCNLASIYVLSPLTDLKKLIIGYNKIVHLNINFSRFTQLETLRVEGNLINDFTPLKNLDIFHESDQQRCFDLSKQRTPSQEELHVASQMKLVESPNFQLIEIQNIRKTLKNIFNEFQNKINAVSNKANSNNAKFISSVVRLFQQLDQYVSQ
ncbi:leucine-rich_repeat domain-containing protein [Hexamita inflata]|uniref:Leucine-rich repeat domain-containing protein n=1 Tax=Hexamita inflata TaxID=28002 RepID=A0AA86V2W7_9EUKA|nr:leucine-rich repeat domain-containing protein [Hexamita inflata]